MTAEQAATLGAALDVLRDLGFQHNDDARSESGHRSAYSGKLCGRAEAAREQLTSYLICLKVYGEPEAQLHAGAVLFPDEQPVTS